MNKKKNFLIIALMCGLSTSVSAVPGLLLNFRFLVSNVPIGNGTGTPYPKSPVLSPEATLDDHMLTLPSDHPDYTLQLLDENGEIVYETTVLEGVESIALPSSIIGDYELRLYTGGNYYFYYDITL
jgi:hypothetical protein